MSEVVIVGVSHHTAPLKVRERLAVPADEIAGELRRLIQSGLSEGVLLSTCNRVELYGTGADAANVAERFKTFLQGRAPKEDVAAYLYQHRGETAVHHAFRVAASLDSMVVGEPQILGQVKAAFGLAETAGTAGTLLTRCFQRSFGVAKRIRTETGIAAGAVSVSSIAIDLAAKIFGDLRGRSVLLVGAGKMGEAAARSLADKGAQLLVINRSPERAKVLADACGGKARPYERLTDELISADVVVCSTGSPRFIISQKMMKSVVRSRKRRPLFLIDIAVPRDVDPRAGDLENVFLYDVDDLQKVAAENMKARENEAAAAEAIVMEETAHFEAWRRSLTIRPTIMALRSHFQIVAEQELERTLPRLSELSEQDRQALKRMSESMVKKLLHGPMTELRNSSADADGAQLIDAVRRLFDLEPAIEAASEPETEADRETTAAHPGLKAVPGGGSSG